MVPNHPQFATTQWTLVWQAARDTPSGRPALDEIVRRYWVPLYTFARRQGMDVADAEDATQEFLWQVIHGELLSKADPAKGKFRTFLLTAWKRFLIDDYRKSQAQKRGGAKLHVSLDATEGELRYQSDLASSRDPDQVFMVTWARCLLDDTRQRLKAEYEAAGKSKLCDFLLHRLTAPMSNEQYEAGARELQMSATALKVALHRMRQRFGELLRQLVLETVEDPAEVELEINDLLGILRTQQVL